MSSQSHFTNRIIGRAWIDPATLIPHPLNVWAHPPLQQAATREGLDELGWLDRIIVNVQTSHILNGHLRVQLAIEAGAALVPIVQVDVEPDDEATVIATFDRLGQLAVNDPAPTIDLLADLHLEHLPTLTATLGQWQAEAAHGLALQAALADVPEVVTLRVGRYQQDIPRERYDAWRADLIDEVGDDADDLRAAIVERLGLAGM